MSYRANVSIPAKYCFSVFANRTFFFINLLLHVILFKGFFFYSISQRQLNNGEYCVMATLFTLKSVFFLTLCFF